jgi:citrate lyase subunit beta/citryl-CoA lyase
MRLTSLLFVPADSGKKFDKARGAGADGLILDLEDSVAPASKAAARANLAEWIDGAAQAPRDWSFWIRINAFDTGLALDDLAALVRPGLDGIVLPKAGGAADLLRLGHCLDALEVRAGMALGTVRVIVLATETAPSLFNLGSYTVGHPRLAALTWGAEDLSAALGATANRDENGDWTAPYQLARNLCLMAAAAAGVPAIDTIHADFRDEAGFAAACRISRRDGFAGRLAIHPMQVAAINHAYAPTDADLVLARRIMAAFAANPGLGTIGIDGKMYDIPHLKRAERMLAKRGAQWDSDR